MTKKLVCTIFLLCLLLPLSVYTENADMYAIVGDYRPAMGYGTLIEKLNDEDWVQATVEEWDETSSPILRGLYRFGTNEDAPSPIPRIVENRILMVIWGSTSLICWPIARLILGYNELKEIKKK